MRFERLASRPRLVGSRCLALSALLAVGVSLLGAAPALAAPPFPASAQATALVGGTPLVEARCPVGSPGAQAGGMSSNGTATVTGAGAMCGPAASADTQGFYTVTGVASPTPLRFSAGCQSSNGDNGGSVDVPAGTSIAGGAAVTATTTVSTNNTAVVFPGGATATLNQVTTTATSVTRSAVVLTNGTIIGRVICGSATVYPLAVDVSSGAGVAPALRSGITASGGHSGPASTGLLLAGAFGLVVLAQVAFGRRIRARRGAASD